MCARLPNVIQPLLYLEGAPVSSAQTHGWNPGLADSKGEPCEKWLWPSDSLQHLTWSYFMSLSRFPFTKKPIMWGKGYCMKIQPRGDTETSVPNRYGHSCSSRKNNSAQRVVLVSGTLCVLLESTHEQDLGGSLSLQDHPVQNLSTAQNSFLTGKKRRTL